jgi:signal transduction histidine kinase
MRQRNEYENEILKARRQSDEAARAKDQFLSFVSHELRSPLSAILGWAAILARADVDAAKMRRGIEAIERNARLQVKLVDDILDHARLATGKVRVELAPTDARLIMDSVLEGIYPAAQAKGVTIDRDASPGPMPVNADAERLQQVFWNMASNAVKFTPAGGRVHAAMRRANGWVEVEVSDTGKGIAADFLPYVFESFRQEEGRVARAEGGLGLGMSITRQLVELHGGSISAQSAGPSKGSTFTVRLPALETAGLPTRTSTSSR